MKKHGLKSIAVLSAVLFSQCVPALALKMQSKPAEPFDIYSANHKYVIHMEPKQNAVDNLEARIEGSATASLAAGAQAGKATPLWTLPFCSHNVIITNDGATLIELGGHYVRSERIATESKLAFIDKSGMVVVPGDFSFGSGFSEGLAAVAADGKYGYIDKSGNWAIQPQFENAQPFNEGLAMVVKSGKYGFTDHRGNLLIPCQFDSAEAISDGLAAVKMGDKWGVIDKRRNDNLVPRFQYAPTFREGLAVVRTSDMPKDEYVYIDKNGKQVISAVAGGVGDFSGGYARSWLKDKAGFIDKYGKPLGTARFDSCSDFSEGLGGVTIDRKDGFIDASGNIVIKPHFDSALPFAEGFSRVRQGNKFGFIDDKGNIVIKPKYDDASSFSDGLAAVCQDEKWGFIDKSGAMVVKPAFSHAGGFSDGLAPVKLIDQGLFLAEPAIAFYKNGKLLKQYLVKDLISKPTPEMISQTLGGGWMPWRKGEARFSPDEKRVVLDLANGTTCTFDVATGALEGTHKPFVLF